MLQSPVQFSPHKTGGTEGHKGAFGVEQLFIDLHTVYQLPPLPLPYLFSSLSHTASGTAAKMVSCQQRQIYVLCPPASFSVNTDTTQSAADACW